jgi:hypothetical protein
VRFVVTQISPVCRGIGSFAVAGRSGLNRVPLRARVGRHRLEPGTYRLVARLGRRALFGVEIVVSRGRVVRRTRLASGALGDPCRRGTRTSAAAALPVALQLAALRSAGPKPPSASTGTGRQAVAAPPPAAAPSDNPGAALGAQFTRAITGGSPLARALVLAAVALAIALLGTAALPDDLVPSSHIGAVVVRRRIELALAGASTLLVAVLAYLAFVA